MAFTNIVDKGTFTTGFCTLCQSNSIISTCIIYHNIMCVNCMKSTNECVYCNEKKCAVTAFSQKIKMENIKKQKRTRLYAFVEEEEEEEEEIEIDEFDLSGLLIDDIDESESEPTISVVEYMTVF
jgi:hypothetical protein